MSFSEGRLERLHQKPRGSLNDDNTSGWHVVRGSALDFDLPMNDEMQ
jgi:hypothetical protein